jgi:predicted phosphohydrolase
MKIQYCSDLHADMGHQPNYLENNTIIPSADILVLAGDIHRASLEDNNQIFNWLSQNFERVFWLPGNHEFYNGVNVNKFKSILHPIRDNVFLVNNQSITLEGEDTTLFFSTLWSKLDPIKAHIVANGMNDFHLIKVDGQLLNIALYDYLHTTHLEWLKNEVENNP